MRFSWTNFQLHASVEDDPVAEPAVLHPEEAEVLVELGDKLVEGRGGGVERHEDILPPRLDPERAHARGSHVEPRALLHVGGPGQAAGEVVDPAVIRALERARVAAALGDLHAPVRAHVVEGRELAGISTGDGDGLAGDAHREVIARPRQLLDAAGVEPVPHEEALDVEPVELRRGVECAGRMAGLGERTTDGGRVGGGHGAPSGAPRPAGQRVHAGRREGKPVHGRVERRKGVGDGIGDRRHHADGAALAHPLIPATVSGDGVERWTMSNVSGIVSARGSA